MNSHVLSGPSVGALMVVAGILVGAGKRRFTRTFWRPDQSVAFALPLLLGLCLLYGTAWLLQAV
jgi:hypothetical protein